MIAGDFNETLKEKDRRSNSSKTKYQTVNSLKTLLKTNDLIEIWRELNVVYLFLVFSLMVGCSQTDILRQSGIWG